MRKYLLFGGVGVAVVLVAVIFSLVRHTEERAIEEAKRNRASLEYGSWIWISPDKMKTDEMRALVADAEKNGINTLYITIDPYLDIAALPEGPAKTNKIKTFSDSLEQFIVIANEKRIVVDAEAGWRDWAEPEKREKAKTIVAYAMQFNAERTHKLRGIQFDVEPYLLPNYEEDKGAVLYNFVELVDQTTKQLGDNTLAFSIVIPHFYDAAQKWTPLITYENKRTYTFSHLLKSMDSRPGSSIIIMAYRNTAVGENSIVELAREEVAETSLGDHPTRIIVAQESGKIDPAHASFYSKTKSYYLEQLAMVHEALQNSRAFGGTAIHHLESFLTLK